MLGMKKQNLRAAMFSILFLITMAFSSSATTAVIPSDESLVVSARLIVRGRVTSIVTAQDPQTKIIYSYVTLQVGEVFKGRVKTQSVVLKEVGGEYLHYGTRLYGTPKFELDKDYLIYLNTWKDGALKVHQMFLGNFRIETDAATGRNMIIRDTGGENIELIQRSELYAGESTSQANATEYYARLRRLVRNYSADSKAFAQQYYLNEPLLLQPKEFEAIKESNSISPQWTNIQPSNPVRWFEPDDNQPVTFYVNPEGASAGVGGNATAAMGPWSGVAGTSLRVVNGGNSSECGLLVRNSQNTISFNNCDNYFQPGGGCASILAAAGVILYDTSERVVINGISYGRALLGNVSFNPYASCYFDQSCNVQEIATHELGHALGFGHSSDSGATMAAYAHFDGRCASIRPDDEAGVQAMYPASGGGGGGSSSPQITTSTLPDGVINIAYSYRLEATGGSVPLSWTVDLSAGRLPSGLSMSPTGEIRGTPNTEGSYSFTVEVRDSQNRTARANFTIRVNASGGGGGSTPLEVVTASLNSGVIGSNYSQTLSARGGTTPYSWQLTSGNLPPGLSLTLGGAITGTPSSAGTSTFVVSVTDAMGATAQRSLSLQINSSGGGAVNVEIVTESASPGVVGEAYAQTFEAVGGTGFYQWSVIQGNLPPGLRLSTGGLINGTPTQAENYNLTLKVIDSAGVSAQRSYLIVITQSGANLPPRVTTSTLPNGTVGTPYSQTLGATGGRPPLSWTLRSGRLPAGLNLNGSGLISGTPSTAETTTFVVEIRDSQERSGTANLSLTVVASGSGGGVIILTENLPDGRVNTDYSVEFQVSGGSRPYTWRLASGQLPAGVTISSGSGRLYGRPTVEGEFSFQVEVSDSRNQTARQAYTLKITGATPPPPPPGNSTLLITTPALPPGKVSSSYQVVLTGSGGTLPYRWSVSSGRLPDGISIDPSSGSLSGTPTLAGRYTFVITLMDARNLKADKSFEVIITDQGGGGNQPLTIITTALSGAVFGKEYKTALKAIGGTGTYRWFVIGGDLPGNLNLIELEGVITGIPVRTGQFTIKIAVLDALFNRDEREFKLSVTGPGKPPPSITKVIPKEKKIVIYGEDFDETSQLFINGQRVEAIYDVTRFVFNAKKSKLPPGRHEVQIINQDGAMSNVVSFER
jgi:hypothetical protein